MIVLLDMKNKKIKIYTDNGINSINFSNLEAIKQIIGKEEVIYVTGAVKATITDIIDVIKTIDVSDIDTQEDEPVFIRTTSKGHMIINEIPLTLEGPSHFYPLKRLYSEHGQDVFEKYKCLGYLLSIGKLQIITEAEARVINKQCNYEKKKHQSKIDASLDSIIVDGKVDDFLENYDSEGSKSDHSDAVHIDVKAGVGGGGRATSNEGSLLPDDFDGGGSRGGGSSNEGSLLPDDFEG